MACLSVYDINTMPTWSVSCTGMTRAPSIATAICLGCAQTNTVSTCIIKPTTNQKWRNEVITVELLKFVVAQFSWISYVPLIHKFTSSMIYETQNLHVSIVLQLQATSQKYVCMILLKNWQSTIIEHFPWLWISFNFETKFLNI